LLRAMHAKKKNKENHEEASKGREETSQES